MYKEDTSITIKTGVENMSPKRSSKSFKANCMGERAKKRDYHQIIK